MVAMEFASLKLSEPNPGGIPASTPREKDRGPQKTRQLPKPTRKWIKVGPNIQAYSTMSTGNTATVVPLIYYPLF